MTQGSEKCDLSLIKVMGRVRCRRDFVNGVKNSPKAERVSLNIEALNITQLRLQGGWMTSARFEASYAAIQCDSVASLCSRNALVNLSSLDAAFGFRPIRRVTAAAAWSSSLIAASIHYLKTSIYQTVLNTRITA